MHFSGLGMGGLSRTFEDEIKNLPEGIIAIFNRAVQTGCWPDGRHLTSFQYQICREALILRHDTEGLRLN